MKEWVSPFLAGRGLLDFYMENVAAGQVGVDPAREPVRHISPVSQRRMNYHRILGNVQASYGTGIHCTSLYMDACSAVRGACFLSGEQDTGNSILLVNHG